MWNETEKDKKRIKTHPHPVGDPGSIDYSEQRLELNGFDVTSRALRHPYSPGMEARNKTNRVTNRTNIYHWRIFGFGISIIGGSIIKHLVRLCDARWCGFFWI